MVHHTIISINTAFGISGLVSSDSPTEYKDLKNETYHNALKKCQDEFTWDKYPLFNQALMTALKTKYVSPDVKGHIRAFFSSDIYYTLDSHLKEDNKSAVTRTTAFGTRPRLDKTASELYNILLSPESSDIYYGDSSGLYIHDFIGAWLHSTEGDNPRQYLEQIVKMSPFVLSSQDKFSRLLDLAEGASFIMAQEYHRSSVLDDIALKRGWEFIRGEESTAFGYRINNIEKGVHPVPKIMKTSYINPKEYYDSKYIFTNEKDIDGIEKATKRTLPIIIGNLKLMVTHWKQPKTNMAFDFQCDYMNLMTDEGFIIGGDTNCSTQYIDIFKKHLKEKLLGDYKVSTTKKRRTDVRGTHGQVCDVSKANIWVLDPKTQFMVGCTTT